MSFKDVYVSRQQKRAARNLRKDKIENIPVKERETLNNVLAALDYEHIALGFERASHSVNSSAEGPKTSETAIQTESSSQENPLAALGLRYDHLYPGNLQDKLQTILANMAGFNYDSAAQNSPLVSKLKQIINGAGFELSHAETGQLVRSRFIDPPRAKPDHFQLRTADAEQTAVYTGVTFLTLQIPPETNQPKPR